MEETADRAIAIVGLGAILPDAPNVASFWENVKSGRYSISEVPPDRWDPALYYDPDPRAPEKTYSKIGGWVRYYEWDPRKWHLPIPPRVSEAMDDSQKWALACTREALADYGYPQRPLDPERTAVILGNAMAGEKHYLTCLRIFLPEYAEELSEAPSFAALSPTVRAAILKELRAGISARFPEVTEDTMPGELSNCIAGRIANLLNFRGPNYVVDAACASAMAAISAAYEGLIEKDFDAVITGGIDRNMGPTTFVKFCKVGALSATSSRPYAEGADGFVMGEGAVIFLLKRLEDAERDGDKIYAVIRGIGGSSDGKGKGITAPNPIGQRLCIERAWKNAGLSPTTATLIEGHGTSTRVGDVVEVQSLMEALGDRGLPVGSIALGSVKSNIGHLKSAAAAAGLLKAVLALHEKVLPPSINFHRPNPDIDFAHSPFYVNTELKEWPTPAVGVRRAGVSAFGFGGTNFHTVLEEYIPGRLTSKKDKSVVSFSSLVVREKPTASDQRLTTNELAAVPSDRRPVTSDRVKAPLRGALVLGAASEAELAQRLRVIAKDAEAGQTLPLTAPSEADLRAPERLAIDYGDAEELATKAAKAFKALAAHNPAVWKALRAQGIFRGSGPPPKVAFLYTGQGSQYVNMLKQLREIEPIIAETFAEADRAMRPLLGQPLSTYIFVDHDPDAVAKAEEDLRQTAITQPAVLTVDIALTRLLAAYGITPDLVMGHSLGEYGALVAAGVLPFDDALEAVSARGREMTRVSVTDSGLMAAVAAPLDEIERILQSIEGYVVIANINSKSQAVIGGATRAVEMAMDAFQRAGYNVVPLAVSHAFHTSIVGSASEPLRRVLERLRLQPPKIPVVANVTGEFYPMGPGVVPQIIDLLAQQIASPVQFVKGLHTLYEAGARVFVEVGPKRVLHGFVEDVLGDYGDVVSLFTNQARGGDVVAFNRALCGLYAAGLGKGKSVESRQSLVISERPATSDQRPTANDAAVVSRDLRPATSDRPTEKYHELGRLFAETLERGWQILKDQTPSPTVREPVVITGASLGLPGTERIFDEANVARILRGEQFITPIPLQFRQAMLDKRITRLVKSEDGGARFETIERLDDVIKLAARGGEFDLGSEFGVSAERLPALDIVTCLAMAAGIDALRDAGIPLVMRYKTTSKGTQLPDRWGLPEALRDDTGVIFASAFPGYDFFAGELTRYHRDRARREQLELLERLKTRLSKTGIAPQEIEQRINELRAAIEADPYTFDRRFLFRALSMGHSQFAELIGARGPNTQINAACASTAQAIALAEDWIRVGRCRRVIVISADNVTSDNLLEWIGAGFLASGAAATDERVEDAAIPFDRRRHGLIIGMGAAALVLETAEAARERGLQPICELLATATANSAFHGTRLDVEHIGQMMERLVSEAEKRWGLDRFQIAPETVFVSHETYTPARGGSASAEVHALRRVFGRAADQIVVANTKGYTGHPMGTGIEEAVAVKILETGLVPPVANFKEVDPELGLLNLSRGGAYPVRYALRLAAGFGSQIAMALLRWVPTPDGRRRPPTELGFAYRITDAATWNEWLSRISGDLNPELEVVQHMLRVKDQGSPARLIKPAPAVRPEPAVMPAVPPVMARVPVAEPTPPPPTQVPPPVQPSMPVARRLSPAAADQSLVARTSGEKESVRLPSEPSIPPTSDQRPAPSDEVKETVLALVAEKTGYPTDMLDVDLDLEADLGIDTVKQAEIFAAIRERYNIPRDDKLKLRDFPTLAHVIRFVYDRRTDLAEKTVARRLSPVAGKDAVTSDQQPAPSDEVKETVLALVAEKTGYPTDMLDVDLDLEADLGIDTVKQAEIFAAIRERYNIPRDDKLKLRDFPTLAHVIRFVYDRRTDLAEKTVARRLSLVTGEETTTSEQRPATRDEQLAVSDQSLDRANAIPRRVPVPIPRPPLKLCKPTGVALGPGSRVVVMPDRGGVSEAVVRRLEERGVEVLKVDGVSDAEALRHLLESWLASGPIQGVYWLPALDDEGDIRSMDVAAWRDALRVRVKFLYTTMRTLYEQIGKPGSFLISATRLGGQHGYDNAGATAPLGGPVVGFTKTYKRERSDALVKVVDFELERSAGEVAEILIEETLRDPGVVEVGYRKDKTGVSRQSLAASQEQRAESREQPTLYALSSNDQRQTTNDGVVVSAEQRWTVGLQEQSAYDGLPGLPLTKETVFVVTGAAGGIVSAIIADLAAASGGTFYLLDKVPEPDPENPDIERFVTDKENLKRELFERIKARGERATPALVEKELFALERAHAALSAIRAVEKAGGIARYYSVDLMDADAVAKVIADVREHSGRIDVLLHAAGLEVSHFLPDKEPREFDLVFDVKCDGWFNLLHAIGDMPLGATVVFSSVAGRFGNAGQTDYSAANDLLCKTTSNFRRSRPGTRAIAIDWTAWGGIGMATRGSIPKMMEAAGIDMLPPEAAVPVVRRELTAGGTRGEVVIGQRLGVLLNEWDPTGGLDTAAIESRIHGPMIGKVAGMGLYSGLTIETTLDPTAQPFLYDHQIDETPVLPGVMGIEAFAEVATLLLPGWQVTCVEDVNFLSPLKFYRRQPRTLTLRAIFYADGEDLVADCCLIASRTLPAKPEPEVTTHFTGRVRLGRRLLESEELRVKSEECVIPSTLNSSLITLHPSEAGRAVGRGDIYRIYFHGPAYQVLESVWRDGEKVVGLMAHDLPANHHPAELPTFMAPRLIETCFQTAGIWELGTRGSMGLPHHVDRVSLLRDPERAPDQRLLAIVTPNSSESSFDAQVVDAAGTVYVTVQGYRTTPLPDGIDPELLKPLQAAMA